MQPIAQTNVQLFNQLRLQNRSLTELELIHRAYDLATRLYSGCFQADGKPFVSHVVGVASALAQLDMPAEIVAAGCIHNVYGNGNFGDGLKNTATKYRRKLVRDSVSPEVEECIYRFRELRLEKNLPKFCEGLDKLDKRDQQLIVMDLADILDKYAYLGVLYFGDNRWVNRFALQNKDTLIKLANDLGYPQMGTALEDAFITATTEQIPEVLKSEPNWKYLRLIVPESYHLSMKIRLRNKLSRIKKHVKNIIRNHAR